MISRAERATSFGAIAEDYDRLRPGPAAAAVDWLLPAGTAGRPPVVADLGAGTGLLSRALASRGARVVAVEPDERMRAVLAARSPGVRVVAGRGEQIPLPDASADGVCVSSAWHWMDPELAVPEITRVLRVGGVLGVIWVSRAARVPWVAEFNQLARESREADGRAGGPADGWAGGRAAVSGPGGRWRRQVTFPPGTAMSPAQERTVEYSLPMTKADLLGLLGTYSGVITLEPERRAAFTRRVQAYLDRQPWERADLPMICRCLRSTRLPG